jgi:hypothetical protein
MEGLQDTVKGWQPEDEIKADLRELTAKTRKLRRELTDMLRGSETKPERRYLHKQALPGVVADSDRKKRKKRR